MKVMRYIKDNYATVGLWILLFFIMWIQAVPQTHSIIEATLFAICLIASAFPFTKHLSETLLQRAMKKKRMKLFTFQFIAYSIAIGIIFTTYLYLFSFMEYKNIFPSSKYFDMNVPTTMLLVPISAGVAINVCICGIRFFEENIKLKKTLVEYQLRTLQHQVTPHFMFNVLNHINILMQSDVELASGLLIKYSEILRYQLYNGEKQKVMLEQDIQFLKDFIAVEEIRWEGKLTVNCEWKMQDPQKEIPALLFITFVENAFKHVSKSDFEKGYINIDFKQESDKIYFNIENSKSVLPSRKKNSGGLGLKNIKERLEILFFGNYDLFIEETDKVYQAKLVINI